MVRISRETGVPVSFVLVQINDEPGLWVGFTIDGEGYWLRAEEGQIRTMQGNTWFVWIGIAVLATLFGSVGIARLINRPLKQLSFAASRIRELTSRIRWTSRLAKSL